VLLFAGLAPAATAAWMLWHTPAVLGGDVVTESLRWVPALGLDLTVRLDGFGLLMAWLVSGIGVLIFWYADAYMPASANNGRFASYLVAFAGSMLGLVLADNVLGLFVFWELTTITSYLLIGWDDRIPTARSAATRALIVTGAGGLVMLAGFLLIGLTVGSYDLSAITEAAPTGTVAAIGVGLVLVGAFTKSAQFPFQGWLPDAMAAPTPVSAYIHSATMVKAGIVILARFSEPFSGVSFWQPLVVTVGLVTMLVGGVRALQQTDLKRLLAFSTVSQLGFMTALFGVGTEGAIAAGVAVLVAHSIFKAALFMVTGAIDHTAGSRDVRELTGLRRRMPVTFWVATIAAASMAGIPPLLGFLSKEVAYDELLHSGEWGTTTLVGVIVGSALTLAYGVRFLWGAFGDKTPAPGIDLVGPDAHRPTVGLVGPAAVLALATVTFGLFPAPLEDLARAAAGALAPGSALHLALWNGFTLSLLLSGVTIALGILIIVVLRPIALPTVHAPARARCRLPRVRRRPAGVRGPHRGNRAERFAARLPRSDPARGGHRARDRTPHHLGARHRDEPGRIGSPDRGVCDRRHRRIRSDTR